MRALRIPAILTATCLLAGASFSQSTARISVDSQGAQANGESRAAAISADGRWIAFKSLATNLVPGDTNSLGDVFLHDRHTGITSRVSLNSAGMEANGESFSPSLSLDGQWIAFHSAGSNLVAGDANGRFDVFVRDRVAGTTVVVSVDAVGVLGNGDSDSPSSSSDGSRVAFRSLASNLLAGDVNNSADVFVYDFATGAPVLASVDSNGVIANGDSGMPSLSGDGRWVAFASLATNLVPSDTNGVRDIFVHDLTTGSTVRASLSNASVQANGASDAPSISGDGRFVAFESLAGNLTAGDSNGLSDVFVRDVVSGSTVLASSPSGSGQSNGASSEASLSLEGRFVSFTSAAGNLVTGDNNARDDIFVVDIVADTISLKSLGANGLPGNGHSRASSLSAGGRRVAFKSDAPDLIPGDANAAGDIFLRDTPPTTIYVDIQALPGGDGSAASPHQRVQDAIASPSTLDLDTVSVQPGTYVETLNLLGKSLTLAGSPGPNGTIVDGNYLGTVVTITSGEGPETAIRDLTIRNGLPQCLDCSYLVGGGVLAAGTSLSFQNVTIEACQADIGSALSFSNGNLSMAGCLIRDNSSLNQMGGGGAGGAVSVNASTVQLTESTLTSNWPLYSYGSRGGGIGLEGCNGIIDNCIISGNASGWTEGGGLFIGGGQLTISNCSISGNGSGEADGGGAAIDGSAVATFSNCEFVGNGTDYVGGGACIVDYSAPYVPRGSCTFTACRFISNHATWGGGFAVRCAAPCSVLIESCLIQGNYADNNSGSNGGTGGGIQIMTDPASSISIRNCVVSNNYAIGGSLTTSAGGVCNWSGASLSMEQCTIAFNRNATSPGHTGGVVAVSLLGSIVWGNIPDDVGQDVTATWSDLGVVLPGIGNISVDPHFWTPADVYLGVGSPCIDASDPNSPPDPDGSVADMGAIPFDGNHLGAMGTYCTAKQNSSWCFPEIRIAGSPSITGPDDLLISAANVLANKSGLLFWGSSPAALPFLGGTLCVHPPIIRSLVQNSGGFTGYPCTGTYTYLFSHSYMQSYLLGAGSTVCAQYWSRDPGFAPPNNVGLTDAVVFEIWP